MAIMSTHPRDFDRVRQLSRELPVQRPGVRIVPCFGVHPWFLHELTSLQQEQEQKQEQEQEQADWHTMEDDDDDDSEQRQPFQNDNDNSNDNNNLPFWITEIERMVTSTPGAIIGEIGLDGFHFDPVTKELVSPMEKQVEAFRLQMELAARLDKPVSVHGVQCYGAMMPILAQLKQQPPTSKSKSKSKSKNGLPPKIYFHAFGGKAGTVDQLTALCGRETAGRVYFGFAPVINLRSPRTAAIVRRVGIERLVLETDHEDAALVPDSMAACIRFLSETLEMEEQDVIDRTTANAFDLYGL
jgi:Tat protein secretion system quality control protein TatD with DNase activity